MNRFVFFNPAGMLGGGELSMLDLLASLGDFAPGSERHLIITADGPLFETAESLGVRARLVALPARAGAMGDSRLRGKGKLATLAALAVQALPAIPAILRYVRTLKCVFQELKPTLIHTNGLKAHILTRLAAPKGLPVVWHVRDFLGSRPVMAPALRWASKRATGAIAISNAVAADIKTLMPNLPVRVIYDGIDLERFTPGPGDPSRLDLLAGLPQPTEPIVRVGLIATYARWKGQDTFLDAAAKVKSNVPTRFYIIGSPIYATSGSQFTLDELKARAKGLGLGDRVGFVPFQGDPEAIFRSLDIVVHASSRPEPFGRTIAEAMACARPVIVSAGGGAAELFKDGEDALGFPPGDVGALALRLDSLLDSAELRDRLSRAAHSSARARFPRERLGAELLDAYRSIGINIHE